jgi:hypothetical protein
MIPSQNTSKNNQMQKLAKKTPKKIHDERPQKVCHKQGKKLQNLSSFSNVNNESH